MSYRHASNPRSFENGTRNASNASIILVGGLPRTGGSLLPFLIDGHEGFFGMPFELHLSQVFGGPPTAEFFRTASKDKLLKSLLKDGLYYNYVVKDGHVLKGLAHIYEKKRISGAAPFDRRRFLAELGGAIDNRVMAEANYLDLISRAFIAAIGLDPASVRLIVNHSSFAILTETSEIFDRICIGQYIYTRRPSLDWLASTVKRQESKGPAFGEKRYFMACLVCKHFIDAMANTYARSWPDRYHIVDFADSVFRPDKVINDIHAWVGLPDPQQLSPKATHCGRDVAPNTSFAQKSEDRGASSFALWEAPHDLKTSLFELQCHLDEDTTVPDPLVATGGHALAWMVRKFGRELRQGRPEGTLSIALRMFGAIQQRFGDLLP
jgi:hypothetical protein